MRGFRQLVRRSRAWIALACLSLPLSCVTECKAPYDRTTPEQTIASFHRAFRCDDADAEYRCLSGRLKTQFGTLSGYTIARAYLREKDPLAVRFIANASLDGKVRVATERGGIRARATIEIDGDKSLEIELINEPEYIVHHEDGKTTHGYAQRVAIDPSKRGVRIEVIDPEIELMSSKPPETIDLRQHWVIDAFPGLDDALAKTRQGNT